MTRIKARNVGKSFGGVRALDDISFSVESGSVGLVGVNGAGKSTLLNILATAVQPDSGSLEIGGLAPDKDAADLRRRVALMPQSLSPPVGMRLADFMRYMAWARGVPRARRSTSIADALAAVDLADRARTRMTSLSGGMLRRALFAQALVADPDVLLLDEPTSGLDPEQRTVLRQLISAEARRRIVIVSSHLMEDIASISSRVIMLDAGRVCFDGTTAELEELGSRMVVDDSPLTPLEAAFMHLRVKETS